MPVVAKILPYINGLTIALQRLFSWIGKSLGIDMSKITSSVGDSSFDMGELEDATDGVGDALDDVSKKAKKAKNNINTIGIDKLNIISKDKDKTDTSSSNKGLGKGDLAKLNKAFDDAYKKYQEAWNKAYKSVDNKALKIANKITKAFKKGDYEEIGKYIGEKITKGLNEIPWKKVYQGGKDFGKNFADFLNGLISPELFGTVGETIASSLNTAIYTSLSFGEEFDFENLGESIASGINNFFETFDFKSLAKTINTWAQGIRDAIRTAIKEIKWSKVFKGIGDFIGNIDIETIGAVIELITLKKVGKWLLSGKAWEALKLFAKEKTASAFKDLAIKLGAKFGLTSESWEALKLLAKTKVSEAFKNISVSVGIKFTGLKLKLAEIASLPAVASFATSPNGVALGEELLYNIEKSIADAVGEENYQSFWDGLWSIILGPLFDVDNGAIDFSKVGKGFWDAVSKSFFDFEYVNEFTDGLTTSFNKGIKSIQQGDVLGAAGGFVSTVLNALGAVLSFSMIPITSIGKKLIKMIFGVDISEKAGEFVGKITKKIKEKFEDTKEFFGGVWNGLTTGLGKAVNGVIGFFEGMANKIIDAWNWIKKSLNSLNIEIPDWVPGIGGKSWGMDLKMSEHISIDRIAEYATGGFPEDGFFFANHSELVGKFSNGKTAVANNAQITDGIEEASYRGFMRALASQNSSRGSSEPQVIQLVADGKVLTEIVNRNNARKGASMLGYGTGY